MHTVDGHSNIFMESSFQGYSEQHQVPPPSNPYHQEQQEILAMPHSQPQNVSQYNFPLQDYTSLAYTQEVQLRYPQQLQSNNPYPLAFPS